MRERILIIGSSGQIGTELVMELRKKYGNENVIASDIRPSCKEVMESGPFEELDIMNQELLISIVKKYKVTQVYLLAALLSATAEQNIELGWRLNMRSHSHVLDLAKDGLIKKIFWPSSIAVFGPTTPRENTPQYTVMEPNTVYGITKQAGERWNEYYFNKFGIDVRSIRYPGLIGWKASPGGGTTDYAVDIFHQAIQYGKYESFLSENTGLPMMYMPDAIRATIELMEAPAEQVKIRSSYNLAGISFTPKQLA
ncbi:MAG: NAD-dependent epimerase/dehydratase family protein, partial [Flavobacteriales bacterium]